MMIGAMIFSGILVIATALIARKGTSAGYAGAALTAFIGTIASFMCLTHLVLAANSLLIALLAGIFANQVARTRWFVLSSFSVTVLVYAFVSLRDLPYLLEGKRLRAEYPLESLAVRLAYEKGPRVHRPHGAPGERTGGGITPAGGTELEWFEDEIGPDRTGGRHDSAIDAYDRALTLREIHSSFVKQFINSPGFGVLRMVRPNRGLIALPPSSPIRLPARAYEDPSKAEVYSDAKPLPAPDAAGTPAAQFAYAIRDFHRTSSRDFVNMVGFGYIVDREHVAGFQSHQFREMPSFSPDAKQKWQVETLDLLSLLKQPEPMAYVSDDLPRMEELRHAPVRPLNAFESKALAGLKSGEDIEIDSTPDRIRMLGSIRAAKQCLRCHDVERGELLGAFSYRLRLAAAPASKAVERDK